MNKDSGFGLHTDIHRAFRLNEFQTKALKKLQIHNVRDLLYHFPTRYGESAEATHIGQLTEGQTVTIFGKLISPKTSKAYIKKIPMAEAYVEDDTGKIKCIWFNQPYIAKTFKENSLVRVSGKVSIRKEEFYLSNPQIESLSKMPEITGESLFGEEAESLASLYPVYRESRGISSNWIYHSISKIFSLSFLDNIVDPIPAEILEKYNLPGLRTALVWIHTPKKKDHALAARKRFAFEEIFYIQIDRQKNRKELSKLKTYKINSKENKMQDFISGFPFELTKSQSNAISNILKDLNKEHPMSRLLEGDVGSGKTAVASACVYATISENPERGKNFGPLQVAYMAPTEILASQHFESFINYFKGLNVPVGLITGSGCRKFPSKVNPSGWTDISRTQLAKWVSNGEIPIVIGTHSLIQKAIKFKRLGLVIIDEQHRFGTEQRKKLANKEGFFPHLLSMTATPIPRTLALTIYGDLDLTLLDEMPAGRKSIITELIRASDRKKMYEDIRAEIKAGRQAYVICPRIDEPDPNKEASLMAKSVKSEAERIARDIFPEFTVNVLHGKMKPKEKDKALIDFYSGKTNILVATSVVEVGVNVPNATMIVIEGAERFGLAQLHQLRGRVIRSNHQAYCFVLTDSENPTTWDRLKALKQAKNGFELSEEDLKLRGAGLLGGKKQWGISDLGMEAIKNIKMVEAARSEAINIIEKDPELKKYPDIKKELFGRDPIHFE